MPRLPDPRRPGRLTHRRAARSNSRCLAVSLTPSTSPTSSISTRALVDATPRLDPTGQQVAVATYRTLAHGSPASVGHIAATAGNDGATVGPLLDGWGAVFRDDAGDVIGFWGLAVAEMPHRLRIVDRDLYAWCAWDPLFLARIVGSMTVATDDPESGETITYRLGGDGAISELSHPDSVLSFLRPDGEWDDQILATFCHYVLHFTEPKSAQRWANRHEGAFVVDLEAGVELARRHVERTFGEALR